MTNPDEEKEPEYKYVHEKDWTAQMVGRDFFSHHDTVYTDYTRNPPEREDFTEAWW